MKDTSSQVRRNQTDNTCGRLWDPKMQKSSIGVACLCCKIASINRSFMYNRGEMQGLSPTEQKFRKIWGPAAPPKRWKSLKSSKHGLEHFILFVDAKYKDLIPYRFRRAAPLINAAKVYFQLSKYGIFDPKTVKLSKS